MKTLTPARIRALVRIYDERKAAGLIYRVDPTAEELAQAEEWLQDYPPVPERDLLAEMGYGGCEI